MAQHNYNWFIGPYQDLETEQMLFLSPDHEVPGHNHPVTGDEPKPPMFMDDHPDDSEGEHSDEQVLSSLQQRNPFRIARQNIMKDQRTGRPTAIVVYCVVLSVFIILSVILKSRRPKAIHQKSGDALGSYVQIH